MGKLRDLLRLGGAQRRLVQADPMSSTLRYALFFASIFFPLPPPAYNPERIPVQTVDESHSLPKFMGGLGVLASAHRIKIPV